MTTDMREALTAAFETQETPDENIPVVETTQNELGAEPAGSPQEADPVEKGADAEGDTSKVQQSAENKDAAESAAADAAAKAPETVPGTTHRVDRAPASWKKEAKGEWNALPLQARQEIHRREMEVQRVLNENAPVRKAMEEFQGTVQPFMARIQSLGVTPNQAVGHLLRADYTLATGTPQQKAHLIDKLLQDYNVSIEDLDAAIVARLGGQQQPQQQQPNIQALVQQQLQQALAPLYQQQQAQQRQVQEQAVQTVEQMSLDPKYPYFEEVREKMAVIFESGLASDLPSAYKYAVSMTPELSAMTQATQLNDRAQRAAAAAASVSGTPVGGGQQVHVSGGSLREDLEAAFGGASNRV